MVLVLPGKFGFSFECRDVCRPRRNGHRLLTRRYGHDIVAISIFNLLGLFNCFVSPGFGLPPVPLSLADYISRAEREVLFPFIFDGDDCIFWFFLLLFSQLLGDNLSSLYCHLYTVQFSSLAPVYTTFRDNDRPYVCHIKQGI